MNDPSQILLPSNHPFAVWPPASAPLENFMPYRNPWPASRPRRGYWKSKWSSTGPRRFGPGRKRHYGPRYAPLAPRNTTSFLIRARKFGGIAPLVSPFPVTPAILPTPVMSPMGERLVETAMEEWGVDGYGSMKGLIWLRAPEEGRGDEDGEVEEGLAGSDVEGPVDIEQRLDLDLRRFEILFRPDLRVEDQDLAITLLEEENAVLKDRVLMMEREMGDLRMRLRRMEGDDQNQNADDDASDVEDVDFSTENAA